MLFSALATNFIINTSPLNFVIFFAVFFFSLLVFFYHLAVKADD